MELILYSFIWWQLLAITVVSAGYHRYFAHRAFKAGVWYEYYVLSLGTLLGGGSLLGWAGVHRMHHNHSDTDKDPHSPLYVSFWRVLTSTFKVPAIKHRHVVDLLKNPRVMWFHKWHRVIQLVTFIMGLLLPFEWFLVLIISPIVYSYIGFGLINAFCHTKNGVRNSYIINLVSGGEGFHKNHHEDPRNWKIGKHWYQVDPAAWFISLIMKQES